MRSYEMMFVLDPRLSDDEASSLTDDFRGQVEAAGGDVIKVEHWGRRKLAYEIQKLKEGRYVLFYILREDGGGFTEVERRLQQSDKVLRYLTVRTDEELRRAGLPLPEPEAEEAEAEAASEVTPAEEKPAEEKAAEEKPVEDKAAETAPVEEAPAEETPAKDADESGEEEE